MKINGSDLMVFVKVDTEYKSIAFATSHTLEISMESSDISTKDNGFGIWSGSEPGTLSWTMSTENLMSDSGENGVGVNDLLEILTERKEVELVFSLESTTSDLAEKEKNTFTVGVQGWKSDTTNNCTGKAYITSLSVTASNGEKASYSATFTGNGKLTINGTPFQKKK